MSRETEWTREQIMENAAELATDPTFQGARDFLLNQAVSHIDVELVKVLLAHGANANFQESWGDGLLHDLAHIFMSRRTLYGEQILLIARLLLEAGANPNLNGCNNLMPINIAQEHGAHQFEALLLEFGARPDGASFI